MDGTFSDGRTDFFQTDGKMFKADRWKIVLQGNIRKKNRDLSSLCCSNKEMVGAEQQRIPFCSNRIEFLAVQTRVLCCSRNKEFFCTSNQELFVVRTTTMFGCSNIKDSWLFKRQTMFDDHRRSSTIVYD